MGAVLTGERPSLTAGVVRAATLVAVLTLLSRAAGFVRTLVFADSVRAEGLGGIYASVNALPNVLFEVAAGGVLAVVVIPLIAGSLGASDRGRADAIASAALSWTLVLLVPLGLLLWAGAAPISGWLVRGAGDDGVEAGAQLLRVFAVQVPLYGVGIVLSGLLQSHRRFFAVALAPLLSSLVVIGSYLLYGSLAGGRTAPTAVPPTAVAVLGWGTTLGVVVLTVPLLVPALATGWRWRPGLAFPPGVARRAGALAAAGVLMVAAQQGAALAANWLANAPGRDGAFPVHTYVQAVYLLPYAVLAVPIATSAFPTLAAGVTSGAHTEATEVLRRSARSILLLMGLAVAALLGAAPAVGTFFTLLDARRTGEPAPALIGLTPALMSYSFGLLGFGLTFLLTRAVLSNGRALAAGGAVALGWAVAGIVPLVTTPASASGPKTLHTLGLWSSVGMTLSAVVLSWLVRRSWGPEALAGLSRTVGSTIIALAAGLLVGDQVGRLWAPSSLFTAATSGIAAALAAAAAFVLVVAVTDSGGLRTALARGRARRRGGAST